MFLVGCKTGRSAALVLEDDVVASVEDHVRLLRAALVEKGAPNRRGAIPNFGLPATGKNWNFARFLNEPSWKLPISDASGGFCLPLH